MLVAALAGRAPAGAVTGDWFVVKSPYSDVILKVDTTPAAWPTDHTRSAPLSYADWASLGFPKPLIWPATYFTALPWSSNIYAVTVWPDEPTYPNPRDGAFVDRLTYSEWLGVGRPAPTRGFAACQYASCFVEKNASSAELFMTEPGADSASQAHKLTPAEWKQAGYPSIDLNQPTGYYKFAWSPVIFNADRSLVGPRDGTQYGAFFSCSWGVTPAFWANAGYPTPQVVKSMRNDSIFQHLPDPRIAYYGLAGYHILTYAQWQSLGFPQPTQTGSVLPTESEFCKDGVIRL